jgi:glycosyltransferase involved in cell wall biosynthesis
MRILLVASKYFPEYTGAAFRIDSMYRRLCQLHGDLDIEVLCGGIEHRVRASYEQDGFRVNRIRSLVKSQDLGLYNFISSYREALESWRTLSNTNCDLIHVVGTSSLTSTAIYYARLHNIPLLIELVTTGASPVQSLPGLHYLWKPNLHRQTAIIAISQHLAERCKSTGLENNTWYRPNPVDFRRFFPDPKTRGPLREKHTPFNGSDVVLVMVAKFMPQKNQLFLIDVLGKLPDNFKLVLAGPLVESGPLFHRDKEYVRKVHANIKKSGLDDRVHIVCDFVDMAEHLKMADIFLMPNTAEGLGTPLLESIACGIPVIANSNEPAFQDLLGNTSAGFLVEMEVDQWVEKISQSSSSNSVIENSASMNLKKSASSEVIDQQYWSVLNVLKETRADQYVNIDQVLKEVN